MGAGAIMATAPWRQRPARAVLVALASPGAPSRLAVWPTQPGDAFPINTRYGAFVTRFDVYDDFKPFFNDFSNARAMYKPRTGAKFQMAHAVTVVGYDNDGKYWVAKNSWGPGWADDGFFRFAYDCCAVLSGASAEAYGVTFRPRATPAARVLPVAAASRKGCFAYQARGRPPRASQGGQRKRARVWVCALAACQIVAQQGSATLCPATR